MRKVLSSILLFLIMTTLIVGNSSFAALTKTATTKKVVAADTYDKEGLNKQGLYKQGLNSVSVKNGLTMTATATIGVIKGDRTKDNYADPNGDYFADGSNIVKTSEYKSILVKVAIKNNGPKTVDVSSYNWMAELADGYKLTSNMGDTIQIQPGKTGEVELIYYVKNSAELKAVKVTFVHVVNREKYNEMYSEALKGVGKAELEKKYGDSYKIYILKTNIKL